MTASAPHASRKIAIIGAGFSGLCLGIQLKKRGIDNFTIFEKADRVGGTWRENTYPGAECDVPSALYSYSFERNPNWTFKWSDQKEILDYLEHCARKYGLYPHIRFNQEVREFQFQEDAGAWRLETADGAAETFDVVVSGIGQLHKPRMPAIRGADSFRGPAFHSARWDHGVSLEGKNVCCIGNAASALQFIPQIAPKAKKLTVFQRSANWVVPKNDREYTVLEKKLGTVFPPLLLFYRFFIFMRGEAMLYPLMSQKAGWLRKKSQQQALDYIDEKIRDPELRKKLVPDYPMGAKRILFSDDFYDALDRDNVKVVTAPIERIEAGGVVTHDGALHEADVLVYATGFETTSFLTPMRVRGVRGEDLNEKWAREGAEAYLGITHTGFPNFFMMYGPNTNLGHNSIVIMIEAQTRYILSCLQALDARDARWLDVRANVQKTYNEWVQRRLANSVWATVNKSWYKNEQGKITNNWVGRTTEYRRRTRSMNPDDYEFA
jgi:cation diffusion facilitator CzcD-associated flavoprotein CzcO